MEQPRYCPNCGAAVGAGAHFCPNCGAVVRVPPTAHPTEPLAPVSGPRRSANWPLRIGLLLLVVAVVVGAALVFTRLRVDAILSDVGDAFPSITARPTIRPLATPGVTPAPPVVGGLVNEACVRSLQPLADKLRELESRLAVGLNFSAYSEKVADARVAYDRIRVDELDPICLDLIGAPAEVALTNYQYAYNVWNACIEKLGCDLDSIDGRLQGYWAKATGQIDQFRDLMP